MVCLKHKTPDRLNPSLLSSANFCHSKLIRSSLESSQSRRPITADREANHVTRREGKAPLSPGSARQPALGQLPSSGKRPLVRPLRYAAITSLSLSITDD